MTGDEPRARAADRRRSLSQQVRAAWHGDASLSWAFWGFHFGGGLLLFVLGTLGFLLLLPFAYSEGVGVTSSGLFHAYLLVGAVLYSIYALAATVIVWRCSPNVSWAGWTYVARGTVILWLLRLLAAIAALARGPGSAVLVGNQ